MAILRRNCPHCPAEHVAFDLKWSERVPHMHHVAWNCSAVCGACGKPICFIALPRQPNNQGVPSGSGGDMEQHWTVATIWPTKEPSIAPPHTPNPVKKRFLEGEDAFSRHNWNSAVAMYRSALDIATKGMNGVPQNRTFFERLQWLHNNHGITPDIRSWADHVRIEGNAALHDPEEFEENDAKALRFFTEMFLRYVFELPGAVREFRGEPPAAN
jgi:hypothetical protein